MKEEGNKYELRCRFPKGSDSIKKYLAERLSGEKEEKEERQEKLSEFSREDKKKNS